LTEHTLIYQQLDSYPIWWLPVSVVLSLAIHDTYFYWMHRLLHHKLVFKHAHLVHHKSTNPSPWASYSFHVLEAVAEGGVLVVLAFVLPMHPIAVSLFILLGFMINVYGHLGFELMPRRFRNSVWFEVLNTSVHHNLHHSKFRGNYGLYFRVWDRLCKTEHPDYVKDYDRVQQQRFGTKSHTAEPTEQSPVSPTQVLE
jgi:sterol desaturase/sphingolipid hydroxylase (fatty acid hydroxylase superfamily)